MLAVEEYVQNYCEKGFIEKWGHELVVYSSYF